MFVDGFKNTHKVSLFSEMSFEVRLLLLLTLLPWLWFCHLDWLILLFLLSLV